MAEAHPVGFQWVMEAKARGATVIHVDPRFSRTSAMADRHVPIRAGSDIAFLGGIINHVLREEMYFREYVLAYTNVSTILSEDFADTEDLDGVFSGLDREHRTYDFEAWRYQAGDVGAAAGSRDRLAGEGRQRRRPARRSARRPAARRTVPAARPRIRRPTPTRRCSTPVRLPGAEAALLPVHPGAGRADLRHLTGELPCRLRRRDQQFRPRPDHRARVQRRLDPAHGRGAVHPHRRDPADAAGQHGTPGRRHPGPARARLDPGLDRHPDPVRPAARLPAHAARARQRGPRRLRRGRGHGQRLLGEHARPTWSACSRRGGGRPRRRRTTSATATCPG